MCLKTTTYNISMGTWDLVSREGVWLFVCKELTLLTIFLPPSLGSSDVILGIQWLKTLGMTQTNWKQ